MARLPQPGGDKGSWGNILNGFLSVAHKPDGRLKDNSVTNNTIAPGAVTKTTVGLGNVDNTSDADKPISTATQTVLDTKQNITSLAVDVAAHVADSSALDTALTTKFQPQNIDTVALHHLDQQTQQKVSTYNRTITTRFSDETVLTELWANTSAWAGTATVAAGRMYNSALGLAKNISVPAGERRLYRSLLTVPAGSNRYGYFGVSADTAGAAPTGATTNVFLLGISSMNLTILKGAAVTGTVSNNLAGAVGAGNYIATVAIDETNISLSLAPASNPGQAQYSTSILRSQMPGGAINNLVVSNNDTTGTGVLWGPLIQVSDMLPPPVAQQSPGGVALFGAPNPIMINRRDPATSIRHLVHAPGNLDPRIPAPVVLYLHQASSGNAANPYGEARLANVLTALTTAGYIVVSSDNGPSTTGGGASDKYGNQAGLDDYSAAIEWTRQHFNTGSVFLLGPSLGGEFVQNILASRKANAIGGIGAVASISPSTDLVAVSQLPTFGPAVMAAWGATDAASFLAAIQGYNPIAHPAYALRGVPQRFYVAEDDPLVPRAIHVDPLVNKIINWVPEANIVSVATGGHLASTLYQGSDLVAFFNKYR